MKRQVVTEESPQLRQKSEPVVEVTKAIKKLVKEMFATMYASNGIGLAAPQIGENIRVIVIDVQKRGAKKIALINPEILSREGSVESEEGCLSCPGINGKVTRSARVKVQGLDPDGKEVLYEADGLLAVCLQHEIDHLDGVLFVDRMTPAERARAEEARVRNMSDRAM